MEPDKRWDITEVASYSGVSVTYMLDLIKIDLLDRPEYGRVYSDALARRVITTLKIRRKRLITDIWEYHLKGTKPRKATTTV